MRKFKQGERGFTLIELGIVIAVIAILATVVLIGRGFLQTSRVSKMVEAVDILRKAGSSIAGVSGGAFAATSTGNELGALESRGFVPPGAAAGWEPTPGFRVVNVQFQRGPAPGANRMGVQVSCPVGHCLDMWNAYSGDPNLHRVDDSVGELTCSAGADSTVSSLTVCFDI